MSRRQSSASRYVLSPDDPTTSTQRKSYNQYQSRGHQRCGRCRRAAN
nr:MAG TPA: hypothetical protein [Caudoviricetes sp.]